MSGQLKLTLRQPPNVDFVIGFPGIPGSQERPHAAVKGSVELRVGQGNPVKAKWIRVELRKIEILPGGGHANTYSDVVGSGSFNLWTAKEEWEVVTTVRKLRDLPFHIKIPDEVPPSVALENGSGIKYELVASVCYKAKKGLFRRVTAPVMSVSSPIVIDKHELHSAWPAYSQKDSRQVNKDGFTLVVERGSICYGPGDTVLLRATVKSSTTAATIRSYEMALRETAVYRMAGDAKTANGPQIRSNFVGSEKLTVNVQIKSGLAHTVDLKCIIPTSHTTTTVVTATHIEVVYGIAVRAILGDGRDLVIDNIPVMMSNWSRAVSEDTIKRIGWAPYLSHDQPPPNSSQAGARPQSQPVSGSNSGRNTLPQQRQQRPYTISERVSGTVQSASSNGSENGKVPMHSAANEFGVVQKERGSVNRNGDVATNGASQRTSSEATLSNAQQTYPVSSTTGRPPSSSSRPGQVAPRFAVTSADGAADDKTSSVRQRTTPERQASPPASVPMMGSTPQRPSAAEWPSADEEKRRQQQQAILYQRAKMLADATQSGAGLEPQESLPLEGAVFSAPSVSPKPQANTAWPSAEDEKRRIFDEAQDRVRRGQPMSQLDNLYDPAVSKYRRPSLDDPRTVASPGRGVRQEPVRMAPAGQTPPPPRQGLSAGAALYRHAIAAISTPTTPSGNNPPLAAGTPSTPPPANQTANQTINQTAVASPAEFPTAQEEKTQQRYLEAKRAVENRQRESLAGPVPYDSLYPSSNGTSAITSGGNMITSTTPPSGVQSSHTRSTSLPVDDGSIRRHLGRDQAAALVQRNVGGGPVPTPPPRRQASIYESPPPPISPLLENGLRPPQLYGSRESMPPGYGGLDTAPNPQPPDAPSLLSAEQEKARLAAMYERESTRGWLGQPNLPQPPPQSSAPPPPPPVFEHARYERPLNAAEEKARLQAQYAAEEREASMQSVGAGALPPAFDAHDRWSHSTQNQSPNHQPPAQYDQHLLSHAHYENSSNVGSGGPRPVPTSVPLSPPADIIHSPVPTRPHNQFTEQRPIDANEGRQSESVYLGGHGGASLTRDPTISEGKRRATSDSQQQPESAPPLLPRPPAEYVRESQADTRPNDFEGDSPTSDRQDFSLDVRPFSPLDISFAGDRPFAMDTSFTGDRPPIPPKVPI